MKNYEEKTPKERFEERITSPVEFKRLTKQEVIDIITKKIANNEISESEGQAIISHQR